MMEYFKKVLSLECHYLFDIQLLIYYLHWIFLKWKHHSQPKVFITIMLCFLKDRQNYNLKGIYFDNYLAVLFGKEHFALINSSQLQRAHLYLHHYQKINEHLFWLFACLTISIIKKSSNVYISSVHIDKRSIFLKFKNSGLL